MKFIVKQIQVADHVYDTVNADDRWVGSTAAAVLYPEYRARLDTMMRGSKGYKSQYAEYYTPVCEIDAADLDGVFQIGNIGPEESITRLAPMHSVSVGDIIEDSAGTQYMVNSFGFEEIQ
jgi:hypothetical protein